MGDQTVSKFCKEKPLDLVSEPKYFKTANAFDGSPTAKPMWFFLAYYPPLLLIFCCCCYPLLSLLAFFNNIFTHKKAKIIVQYLNVYM